MNLHEIASGAISAVNPMIAATLKASTGYTTSDSGKRTPSYATPRTISIQFQAMTERELRHMEELNVGGVLRKVFTNGTLRSVDRKDGTGGDLLVINSVTWLVIHVNEQWPDWCSVIVQKQVD